MRFTIELTSHARRDLNHRIPERIAAAAHAFISGPLTENPRRVGKPLGGHLAGHRSARVGQYRVVYRIEDTRVVVVVVTIAHRGVVHRA